MTTTTIAAADYAAAIAADERLTDEALYNLYRVAATHGIENARAQADALVAAEHARIDAGADGTMRGRIAARRAAAAELAPAHAVRNTATDLEELGFSATQVIGTALRSRGFGSIDLGFLAGRHNLDALPTY